MKISYPSEDQEQAKLCTWLTLKKIRFFAIPNGGFRNYAEASKFKRCGVQPGVPDIMVPIPSGSYHGLFLELKRVKGGHASDYQIEWLTYLRTQGFYADLAYGADEAIEIITKYLALTLPAA